jgi:hypothetical protein
LRRSLGKDGASFIRTRFPGRIATPCGSRNYKDRSLDDNTAAADALLAKNSQTRVAWLSEAYLRNTEIGEPPLTGKSCSVPVLRHMHERSDFRGEALNGYLGRQYVDPAVEGRENQDVEALINAHLRGGCDLDNPLIRLDKRDERTGSNNTVAARDCAQR